jgi:hypothetical protein
MRSMGKQRKRRTRNLENVVPLLGFANDDLKFPPAQVAEKVYDSATGRFHLILSPCRSRQPTDA